MLSAAASFFILRSREHRSGSRREVLILLDNKVIYRIDLDSEHDRTFRIDCGNGRNDVTIENGQIRISDADCPDQTCVKTGELRNLLPIVCLPHKLVIRFADEE